MRGVRIVKEDVFVNRWFDSLGGKYKEIKIKINIVK